MAKTAKNILTIAFCSFLTLMPQTAPAADTPRDHFRIGMSQYPSTLHPLFDAMVAKSVVLGTALRSITAYDAAWQPVCLLCTELPSFDNGRARKIKNKDGTTGIAATYTLKDDLFWDDGTPVTVKDILFTWRVGRHPQSGVSNGEFYAKDIADITTESDKTFTIHFAREKCEFAALGEVYPLPAHIEEKTFDEDPATYKNRTLYNTAPATKGLYIGPYRVTSAQAGAAVSLEKHPQWKGKPPAFSRITFRAIENSAALSAQLLTGEIDYILGELGLTLDQATSFEKRLHSQRPGKFNVVYRQGLTYEHIDFHTDRAPYDDINLRRALLLAIDRDSINKQLFDGRQPPALTSINPLDTVFTDTVRKYPYDPAEAGRLLDAAGWKLKEDGLRYNDKGEKLTVYFSTTAGNKSREMIQQSIQSDWKKSGITAVIENEPARVLFGDTLKERKNKGGVMYAWMSSPRNIPRTTLSSTMIPSPENNYAGQNTTGYKNPRMDKIIDDLETVCEPGKNTALWHELQHIYADDLPALPLYYRADSFFIPAWLSGVEPTGHLNPSTLWIENWSITP
jgi:peptide/nickel transport system substrate-binding protein